MITRELIDRINSLWHKQKTTGLTEEEKEEQRLARQEYLAGIRVQVRNMLETIKENEDDAENHSQDCGCNNCKH